MFYYIESANIDPCYNLALEQFVFDSLDRSHNYFMLWQNHNSVIVGKNQNTIAEINQAAVSEHNINVVRRLSGGGAVYHDLGNLNFTFITDAGAEKGIDFSSFCLHIQKALLALGVPAEITGRNDITVEGKKISGNAQYVKQGRVMHHGTLLYDSNLDMLSKVLNVTSDKIESKGIKSIKSRVANIRPYMRYDLPTNNFLAVFKNFMIADFNLQEFPLTGEHNTAVEEIKDKIYSQWSWNYGASPAYNIRKTRRIEGCGKIDIFLDVGKQGLINGISFYGDFFGEKDCGELSDMLKGRHLEFNELKAVLSGIDISRYFFGLGIKDFLALLLE